MGTEHRLDINGLAVTAVWADGIVKLEADTPGFMARRDAVLRGVAERTGMVTGAIVRGMVNKHIPRVAPAPGEESNKVVTLPLMLGEIRVVMDCKVTRFIFYLGQEKFAKHFLLPYTPTPSDAS